jgi:hypothetical protein
MRLRAVAGGQTEAAQDLLYVVSQSARLADLATFRSVTIGVKAGNLTFSIEEVDLHAQPLSPGGTPHTIVSRASLPDHASSQALLVQDLRIRGRSILRLAS